MLRPLVFSVATTAVPDVVVEVKPVPAYVVAIEAVIIPALFPNETLFEFENVTPV